MTCAGIAIVAFLIGVALPPGMFSSRRCPHCRGKLRCPQDCSTWVASCNEERHRQLESRRVLAAMKDNDAVRER